MSGKVDTYEKDSLCVGAASENGGMNMGNQDLLPLLHAYPSRFHLAVIRPLRLVYTSFSRPLQDSTTQML
jgi:hypothetical protein